MPSDLDIRVITDPRVGIPRAKQKRRLADNLFGLIADEDTCVGFLLGGIGHINKERVANFFVVEKGFYMATEPSEIDEIFKKFLHRTDIAIILITQQAADLIRPTVDSHTDWIPTIVEIPNKECPYDIKKDSIMKRAKDVIGGDYNKVLCSMNIDYLLNRLNFMGHLIIER